MRQSFIPTRTESNRKGDSVFSKTEDFEIVNADPAPTKLYSKQVKAVEKAISVFLRHTVLIM